MYYERTLSNIVAKATKSFKVVMITGPRQVGKSTLFDNIIEPNRRKVTLDDSSMLDTYEEAYKKVHSYYEGLDYYDTSVVRNNNTVTSTININYDEIDIDKLISIEGEEDNIFTNKVPSVSKWLALGKKFGIKCELVEE